MFYYCSSLNSLNLENFNINNVKDMTFMFFFLKKECEIIAKEPKILNEMEK